MCSLLDQDKNLTQARARKVFLERERRDGGGEVSFFSIWYYQVIGDFITCLHQNVTHFDSKICSRCKGREPGAVTLKMLKFDFPVSSLSSLSLSYPPFQISFSSLFLISPSFNHSFLPFSINFLFLSLSCISFCFCFTLSFLLYTVAASFEFNYW